jgi:hypothetical protein
MTPIDKETDFVDKEIQSDDKMDMESCSSTMQSPQKSLVIFDTMSRPLIFLDIDGVINMFPIKREIGNKMWPDICDIWHKIARTGKKWEISYSPQKIKIINEWSKIAEIRWLTTWNECAIPFAAEIGLDGNFTTARKHGDNSHKRDTFVKNLSSECPCRPVIWIDDDLKHWKESNPTHFARKNTLYVSPANGLRVEHCEAVSAKLQMWCESQQHMVAPQEREYLFEVGPRVGILKKYL